MSEVKNERDVVGGDRNGVDHRRIILSAFLEKYAGPFFPVFCDVVWFRGNQSSLFGSYGGAARRHTRLLFDKARHLWSDPDSDLREESGKSQKVNALEAPHQSEGDTPGNPSCTIVAHTTRSIHD